MGHQITSEGGVNLSPSAPGQIGAEGGVNLAPSSPGHVQAEGGADLQPGAPDALKSRGVAAAFQVTVSGVLTAEGEPVVFPTLLPTDSYNGRMAWTDDGTPIPDMGAGQRLFYLAPYWYLAWEAAEQASWRSPEGLDSPVGASPWTPSTAATGQPAIAAVGPAAPPVIASEGGVNLAPTSPGQIVPDSSY